MDILWFAINGFTFSQNFFLKQKEFTGLQFDWRFVKSWGLFWNVSYDDNGMYVGTKKETRRLLFCRRVGGLALFGTMLVGDFLGLMAKQSSSPRMRWMGFCSCEESTSALSLHHSAG